MVASEKLVITGVFKVCTSNEDLELDFENPKLLYKQLWSSPDLWDSMNLDSGSRMRAWKIWNTIFIPWAGLKSVPCCKTSFRDSSSTRNNAELNTLILPHMIFVWGRVYPWSHNRAVSLRVSFSCPSEGRYSSLGSTLKKVKEFCLSGSDLYASTLQRIKILSFPNLHRL